MHFENYSVVCENMCVLDLACIFCKFRANLSIFSTNTFELNERSCSKSSAPTPAQSHHTLFRGLASRFYGSAECKFYKFPSKSCPGKFPGQKVVVGCKVLKCTADDSVSLELKSDKKKFRSFSSRPIWTNLQIFVPVRSYYIFYPYNLAQVRLSRFLTGGGGSTEKGVLW